MSLAFDPLALTVANRSVGAAPPPILVERAETPAAARFAYAIADRMIAAPRPIVGLGPFRCPLPPFDRSEPRTDGPSSDPGLAAASGTGRLVHRGAGWVGGRLREIECRGAAGSYRLAVRGAGRFTIDKSACRIQVEPGEPEAETAAETTEALLGPCLVLALALAETYCLHASAVQRGGEAIGFIGESGVGKSTLADYLAAPAGDSSAGRPSHWKPVADEFLPVRADGGAYPRFPQKKLRTDEQWGADAPERLPLAALYLLQRSPAPVRSRPAIVQMTPPSAALALVRHTVGSRLFDRDLLARHQLACRELAHSVPVSRLVIPSGHERLAEVEEAIRRDLAATL